MAISILTYIFSSFLFKNKNKKYTEEYFKIYGKELIHLYINIYSKLSILKGALKIVIYNLKRILPEEAILYITTLLLYFTVLPNPVSYIVACIVHALLHLLHIRYGAKLYPVLQVLIATMYIIYAPLYTITHSIFIPLLLHTIDHTFTNTLPTLKQYIHTIRQLQTTPRKPKTLKTTTTQNYT